MPSLPPPSPEVIQEEILRRLEEDGVERCDLLRDFAAVSAHEIAAIWRALGGGLPRGGDPDAG